MTKNHFASILLVLLSCPCLFAQSQPAPDSDPTPALTAALGRLPEHYRQVIVWRQMEDLSFEAMAGRLGRSEAAVRKLWWRALQSLQKEMGVAL